MKTYNDSFVLKLEDWIKKYNLFDRKEKLLLAVSGGIDSVVMLTALTKIGAQVSVAHCNFGLRGKESDDDEAFVKEICQKLKIIFFVKHFDTREYAGKTSLNIQLAARELRYRWFEELCSENGFSKIVVAHHRDDSIETFFINLFRGSGIKGLSGIPVVNGRIIRPLLFATRQQIRDYANLNKLEWRNDSSNASDYYLRNKIRQRLVPEMHKLNVPAIKGIEKAIHNISASEVLLQTLIKNWAESHCQTIGEDIHIPLTALRSFAQPEALLSAVLRNFGFHATQAQMVLNAAGGQPGKVFIGSTHRLIIDRDNIIITPVTPDNHEEYLLEPGNCFLEYPLECYCEVEEINSDYIIPKANHIACLDYDLLHFPLNLRRWKPGDRFMPLGMNQIKKLSDFLIDIHLPVHEKEKIWLLLSDNEVVWIVGKRIDQRFRITKSTKKILRLTLPENLI